MHQQECKIVPSLMLFDALLFASHFHNLAESWEENLMHNIL